MMSVVSGAAWRPIHLLIITLVKQTSSCNMHSEEYLYFSHTCRVCATCRNKVSVGETHFKVEIYKNKCEMKELFILQYNTIQEIGVLFIRITTFPLSRFEILNFGFHLVYEFFIFKVLDKQIVKRYNYSVIN